MFYSTETLNQNFKIVLILIFSLMLNTCHAINPYFDSKKKHHTARGFRNLEPSTNKSFMDFWTWRLSKLQKEEMPYQATSFKQVDLHQIQNPKKNHVQLTWLGHSSLLLQLKGKNILFDPVFSYRVSPLSFIGPKRESPLPLKISDLPNIDYTVISHDHYDHLDLSTLKQLKNRFKNMHTLTPLVYKKWLEYKGIEDVFELDWWESLDDDQLSFYLTPAQHWCKRTPFDTNIRLWGSWLINAGDFKFYFAGDTGFSSHFESIHQKFGNIDLAAIPIGAYEPRWFMKQQHMNPEEALKAHHILKAKHSIGIHWGTFKLTDEPLDEPKKNLEHLIQESPIKNPFETMSIGETIILSLNH